VADVEVGLGAVLGDEDLAVLERVHRAGVDVEVGVELLHRHPQAARPEQVAEAGGRQALAERGGDASGHEDVFRVRSGAPPRFVVDQDGQRGRPFPGIGSPDECAGAGDEVTQPTGVASDHGRARRHGLLDHQSPRLPEAGEDERAGRPQPWGRVALRPDEMHRRRQARGLPPEPVRHGRLSPADDDPGPVTPPTGPVLCSCGDERAQVLLRREPGDGEDEIGLSRGGDPDVRQQTASESPPLRAGQRLLGQQPGHPGRRDRRELGPGRTPRARLVHEVTAGSRHELGRPGERCGAQCTEEPASAAAEDGVVQADDQCGPVPAAEGVCGEGGERARLVTMCVDDIGPLREPAKCHRGRPDAGGSLRPEEPSLAPSEGGRRQRIGGDDHVMTETAQLAGEVRHVGADSSGALGEEQDDPHRRSLLPR
jgi:hypothetical protein